MNRLRELRLERGMVQVQLAARARVGSSLISMIERHGYAPGPDVRRKLAAALRVKVIDIWPPEPEAVESAA